MAVTTKHASGDRITTRGHRNEFQLPMNAKIASVASAGRTSGRMMVTKPQVTAAGRDRDQEPDCS